MSDRTPRPPPRTPVGAAPYGGHYAVALAVGAAALLGVGGMPAVAAAPAIETIDPDPAPRSGRIEIAGSGFGASAGTLRIAGLRAFTTSWGDGRIVGYVPEEAPVGEATVEVATAAGGTAQGVLEVTSRPPAGEHVLWRFRVDGRYLTGRPAVGPDGTIYARDIAGHVYALSPDGGLRWVHQGPSGYGQVDVDSDGTVYVGGGFTIEAITPDGTRKWLFVDDHSQVIIAGPNVGPDGNVYVVLEPIDGQGLGAASFTPAGDLRWANQGDPVLTENGPRLREVVFSAGQLYATADPDQFSNGALYGFTLDGDQRFVVGDEEHQPATGPNGNIYLGGRELDAYAPDGTRLWRTDFGSGRPEAGPDDTIYGVEAWTRLHAVNPDGTDRWVHDHSVQHFNPSIRPDGGLVLLGGRQDLGEGGLIEAVDAGRGDALWRVDVTFEGGFCPVPNTASTFQPDGSAAYLGAELLCAADPPYSYLYAVRTGDGSTPDESGDEPSEETVTVTQAEYDERKQELRIEAEASSGATLRAYVTSSGELIGTLEEKGQRYRGRFSWPDNPGRVTVESSLGGSDTVQVATR